jgi:double-stranded uracil-DNA glycosylase
MSDPINSFSPIAGDYPRILILGTMPSVKSLDAFQYYAHPRNAFWEIVASFCGASLPMCYGERKALLIGANIALWDVCATCIRKGSLDSAIQNEIPNDIPSLLENKPSIRAVLFNGQPAQKLFRRHFPAFDSIAFHTLPSTSPANTMPLQNKREAWLEALAIYL